MVDRNKLFSIQILNISISCLRRDSYNTIVVILYVTACVCDSNSFLFCSIQSDYTYYCLFLCLLNNRKIIKNLTEICTRKIKFKIDSYDRGLSIFNN